MITLKKPRYFIPPCLPVNAFMRVYMCSIFGALQLGDTLRNLNVGRLLIFFKLHKWMDYTGTSKKELKFLPQDHIHKPHSEKLSPSQGYLEKVGRTKLH